MKGAVRVSNIKSEAFHNGRLSRTQLNGEACELRTLLTMSGDRKVGTYILLLVYSQHVVLQLHPAFMELLLLAFRYHEGTENTQLALERGQ